MRQLTLLSIASAALLALVAPSARAVVPSLSVPTNVSVSAGGTTDTAVVLSDGTNLGGLSFVLTLSPANQVDLVGVSRGSSITDTGSWSITLNPSNIADATPLSGSLNVAISSPNASLLPAGPATMLSLRFKGRAGCVATSPVTVVLTSIVASDSGFNDVFPTASNGLVTCQTIRTPTLSVQSGAAVCKGSSQDVAVNIDDGSAISAGSFTLSLSPSSQFEVVGVARGDRLSPAGSFTVTTNPVTISPSFPANGPVTVAITSSGGATMAAGAGSVVTLTLRSKATCSGTTNLDLTTGLMTVSGSDVSPTLTDGTISCTTASPPCAPVVGATITIGDIAGGPGTVVEVPVTLAPAPACGASTLSMDIAFDPSVVSLASPCVATVGGSAAGWSADCQAVGTGLVRVVVFGKSTSMSAGTVVTVRFLIRSNIALGVSRRFDNVACSVSQASPILSCSSTCVDGSVTVYCLPGDWDCNGVVSIAEVQRAVNCMLGRAVTQGCGPVDANADGTVSATELQCVVNNFLGTACAVAP